MGSGSRGSLRTYLIGWAGAVVVLVGLGASVYAAEPDAETVTGTESSCGSIDPGFTGDLEGTLRVRPGGLDPGFATQPNDVEPAGSGGAIDPGFSRPIERCPTLRLEDLVATPVGTLLGLGPASTPCTRP